MLVIFLNCNKDEDPDRKTKIKIRIGKQTADESVGFPFRIFILNSNKDKNPHGKTIGGSDLIESAISKYFYR